MSAPTNPAAVTYPGMATWPSSGVVLPGPAVASSAKGTAAVASAGARSAATASSAKGTTDTASGSG